MIVPNGEDEDHTAGHRIAHAGQTALGLELLSILERSLLSITIVGGDGVIGIHARDADLGVLDDLAILNVETTDLGETAAGGVVAGDELGDNGELLGGVDGHTGTVEGLITHAERVEIATVGITNGGIAILGTAVGTLTARDTGAGTGVRGVGGGDGVGLPDVHLTTASTPVASSGISVIIRAAPAFNISLAVDELDVTRALRVAVAGAVLGASLVTRELGHTTISSHLGEVEGAIETARKVGNVNIERELLVKGFEHLVVGLVCHEVDTRADVLALRLGDEFEGQSVAASGDTVGARVVSTVNSAARSASVRVTANAGIPLVTSVAVGITLGGVKPAPVGIESNCAAANSCATARGGTLLPREGRVCLSGAGTGLLGEGNGEVGESEESDLLYEFKACAENFRHRGQDYRPREYEGWQWRL